MGTSIVVNCKTGEVSSIDTPDAIPSLSDLLDYSAQARFQKETGGITVSGAPVLTDRESQAMVSGAFAAAKDDSAFTTQWKISQGTFMPLDNATILALGRAVRTHVNGCFAKESDIASQIASDAITSYAQIDAAYAGVSTAY